MQGGFSFCGVDISKFGLEYAPTLDQTYVYAGSKYTAHQETFDAKHGGYFYGATVQPKDFVLRCFFQDKHINHGMLSVVENFFRRGRTGKLIFKQRDWVWYTATVVDIDFSHLLNYMNGFVTISLRAFYPFARHDYLYINDKNMFCEYMTANSGMLSETETPITSYGSVTESKDILLYNGGTERAGVAVAIAGNAGDGVLITNETTDQTCKFVAFTKETTTDINKYIVTDAINGKTIITDGDSSEFSFLYHDYGFIELEPSFPIERNVHVQCSANSNEVKLLYTDFGDDFVGKYMYLENGWHKITSSTMDGIITVDEPLVSDGNYDVNIVTMNKLHIELNAGAELTKLDFIYRPTFQ